MTKLHGYGAYQTRETPEVELRAQAREKVAGVARRGELPSETFPADQLQWAFHDQPAELDELERVAEEARARGQEDRARAEDQRELRRETERVLDEWRKRDEADRRSKAMAEARRRLGVEA